MTVQSRLQDAFHKYSSNCGLEVDGKCLTYSELLNLAYRISHAIVQNNEEGLFVSLLGYRSVYAYTGLLGILLAGKAYLPLNPKFPSSRTIAMLRDAKSKMIVVGPECSDVLEELLKTYDQNLPVLRILYLSEASDTINSLRATFKQHVFVEVDESFFHVDISLPRASDDDYAYLLFTSGSTGQPKGIAITQLNVCAYLDFILSRYEYRQTDRISQFFDFTFDPSVHDIFSAWFSGACLCTVPYRALMAPSRFIKNSQLTVWYSVPSVPMFMEKLNMLKGGDFPGLRYSMFSGEALSQSTAEKWQSAAPNSLLVNFYGPTEATVNITYYEWDRNKSPFLCRNGGVPLGFAFPEQEIRIVDSDGRFVGPNDRGELIVHGSQVAKGYINNIEKTTDSFRILPDEPGKVWYFTGDLVESDDEGILHFYGRKDFQVQIRGYRVELSEIEGVIKKAASTEFSAVVPWPMDALTSCAEQLIAVIAGRDDKGLADKVLAACKSTLPSYMVPSKIIFIQRFPLTANGKIDRKALIEYVAGTRG